MNQTEMLIQLIGATGQVTRDIVGSLSDSEKQAIQAAVTAKDKRMMGELIAAIKDVEKQMQDAGVTSLDQLDPESLMGYAALKLQFVDKQLEINLRVLEDDRLADSLSGKGLAPGMAQAMGQLGAPNLAGLVQYFFGRKKQQPKPDPNAEQPGSGQNTTPPAPAAPPEAPQQIAERLQKTGKFLQAMVSAINSDLSDAERAAFAQSMTQAEAAAEQQMAAQLQAQAKKLEAKLQSQGGRMTLDDLAMMIRLDFIPFEKQVAKLASILPPERLSQFIPQALAEADCQRSLADLGFKNILAAVQQAEKLNIFKPKPSYKGPFADGEGPMAGSGYRVNRPEGKKAAKPDAEPDTKPSDSQPANNNQGGAAPANDNPTTPPSAKTPRRSRKKSGPAPS